MRKAITLISAIALALAISGCSTDGGPNPTPDGSSAISTPDPSLIPAVPGTDVKAIDPSLFDVGFSEFLFKVGEGPVWCTINADEKWALCEQSEAAAEYAPVPTPADCEGSYGYQIKLYEDSSTSTLADGAAAGFMCSGGYYSDSSVAQTLNTGESVTVGNIKCYVNDITARCDNSNGQYIAFGPKVWAAKN
jgi:hypothetical protein